MTKVMIWCRHKDDNVIGVGAQIPWHIASDFKRFRAITEGQNLVAGEKTYESFPNRTLPNRKIFVLTFNADYEVSDKNSHFVFTDIKEFKDFEEDLYVVGGASVYKSFMTLSPKLMPDIVVDSVFQGELDSSLQGEKIDVSACVEVMGQAYRKITADYEQDNVLTALWVKKGDFVEQSVLKRILQVIEQGEVK